VDIGKLFHRSVNGASIGMADVEGRGNKSNGGKKWSSINSVGRAITYIDKAAEWAGKPGEGEEERRLGSNA
jgi:hypothetical protein